MNTFYIFLFAISLITLNAKELQRTSRIIGGVPSYVGQFKFLAAINVQSANSRFLCGGTLISHEWILTAGHCVDGASSFVIQLGSNTLEDNDPNRVTVATSEYFLHPGFDPATLRNDIALIKLRAPVEFTNYIEPINSLSSVPLQVSTAVVVMGWGQVDDDGNMATKLNFANLRSISNEECKLYYGDQILDEMVCVSGNYNEGTCVGDSGGPLVHVVRRGEMAHVGVASFVSGNGCESTDPSGFTRTFSYLNWIRNITQL